MLPWDLATLAPERFAPIFAQYKKLYPQLDAQSLRYQALTAESYWIPSQRLIEARARTGAKSWLYRFDMLPWQGVHAEFSVHGSELALVFDNVQDSTVPALGPVGERGRRLPVEKHRRPAQRRPRQHRLQPQGHLPHKAHAFTLARQQINGRGKFSYGLDGGDTNYLANYIQYLDGTREDGTSW
ncbi:hypothetical protein [Pseudomonas typographi]|uniref:Uncharacterized protein n=1 Tax=Pseudomonas typographi TaxID=2715964 RepID=A0ABR7Z2Z8_9PSED|nr:hypothetical protein [Pseudomonas typographi]MBD1599863.1 hypothetical protein [Pseudomonas typographi]